MTTRYVRIVKFVAETGYTARAVETKIHRGVWIEGKHYRRAPDGCIHIDMEEYTKWVESRHQAGFDQKAAA
ncbi:hypothetical protein DFR41_110105 [Pseudacidovorax intermedius]|uniref:Excisionase n=1 Tax=Pseudacidovorax intermedius TaxID=433924 RepID=A0A370F843_9BURK|nr:excisionase [Pseudacidovorax intermedius]RDI20697.1 hypothetical protein DFR41_110105 [Pseudacidovorax intermedius]